MKNFDKEKVDKLYMGPGLRNENCFFNFMDHAHLLTDKEFWYGFSEAYTSADAFPSKFELWLWLQENGDYRGSKHFTMTAYERRYLKKLPQKIIAYRGMSVREFESRIFGMSWTLSPEISLELCRSLLEI